MTDADRGRATSSRVNDRAETTEPGPMEAWVRERGCEASEFAETSTHAVLDWEDALVKAREVDTTLRTVTVNLERMTQDRDYEQDAHHAMTAVAAERTAELMRSDADRDRLAAALREAVSFCQSMAAQAEWRDDMTIHLTPEFLMDRVVRPLDAALTASLLAALDQGGDDE